MGTDSRDGRRQRGIAELFACNDAIARSGELFNEALFDLTGTNVAWEAAFDDDEDKEDKEDIDLDDEEALPAGVVIAVLRREDYLVTRSW